MFDDDVVVVEDDKGREDDGINLMGELCDCCIVVRAPPWSIENDLDMKGNRDDDDDDVTLCVIVW